MVHDYPYTDHSCSMGCFMGMCHKAGVKLAFVGDMLQLLDKNNFVLSSVKIDVATTAIKDEDGNYIRAYIIDAGTREDTVVLTKGNGDEIVITVPYAEKARYDMNGHELNDYVIGLSTAGDKLVVTRGDNVTYELTIPYATKALQDVNEKYLTTYAASLEVSGNDLILRDGMGTIINQITVHYAERATSDENGNNIRETYANDLQVGTTTVKLISKAGDLLSEITVPYATSSLKDTDGNLFLHDYAETLVVDNDGKRLDLLAHDGTLLSAVTVPFSTLSTDATNALERVEVVGDQIVFTTYGGVVTRITVPYAIRALNDGESNEIAETYVHNVIQDAVTGEISFYDAKGNVLCSFTPNCRIAMYDDANNYLQDYIKTLVFDNQSKYLIATHGSGVADSIRIDYATAAWTDDINNIIKNVYVKTLFIEEDNEGRWNLVALNGEGSEIHRLILPELVGAADGGIVVSNHQISLTNEVQSRIYDFTYNALDEEIEVSVHTLTEP